MLLTFNHPTVASVMTMLLTLFHFLGSTIPATYCGLVSNYYNGSVKLDFIVAHDNNVTSDHQLYFKISKVHYGFDYGPPIYIIILKFHELFICLIVVILDFLMCQ